MDRSVRPFGGQSLAVLQQDLPHAPDKHSRRITPTGTLGYLPLILLLVLATAVSLRDAPIGVWAPGRDSGVYLYTGWRILHGEIPYRDVWDHKGPLLYYINALGLLLAGGSYWGVWSLDWLSGLAAVALGWRVISRALGYVPALSASALWVVSVPLIRGEMNTTQDYALPLQFLALYLFWRAEHTGWSDRRGVLMGISGGSAFLLQQNLIGVWAVICLYYLLGASPTAQEWRSRARRLLAVLGGGAGVVMVCAGYFLARGALGDYWSASFEYNVAHSANPMRSHLESTLVGLSLIHGSGLDLAAVCGLVIAWLRLARVRSSPASDRTSWPLAWVLALGLPLEFALSSVSGQNFTQYYLAWLPMLTLAAGFCAHASQRLLRYVPLARLAHLYPPVRYAVSLLLVAVPLWQAPRLILDVAGPAGPKPAWSDWRMELMNGEISTAAVIRDTTEPDDRVLLWGAEAGVLFLSQRQSATRFVYQYPLWTPSYRTPQMQEQFLRELRQHRPALIVDASLNSRLVKPIGSAVADPYLSSAAEFLLARYREAGRIQAPPSGWTLYVPEENFMPPLRVDTVPEVAAPRRGGAVDEVLVTMHGDGSRQIRVVGWAAFAGYAAEQGLRVGVTPSALRSASAWRVWRPDVAQVLKDPDLALAGFALVLDLDQSAPGGVPGDGIRLASVDPQRGTQALTDLLTLDVVAWAPQARLPLEGSLEAVRLSPDGRQVELVGWAPFSSGLAGQLLTVHTDLPVTTATIHRQRRADVAAVSGGVLDMAGFQVTLTLRDQADPDRLRVCVTGSDPKRGPFLVNRDGAPQVCPNPSG